MNTSQRNGSQVILAAWLLKYQRVVDVLGSRPDVIIRLLLAQLPPCVNKA